MVEVAIITLGAIGATGAAFLYAASKKFEVIEDPRIAQVQDLLPGANCGGCGFPGCGGFANACVKASSLDGLYCPGGGEQLMDEIAEILDLQTVKIDPTVAVLRCNGVCSARKRTTTYDGTKSCQIASVLYAGETGCSYGCLGFGDCITSCRFGAIKLNKETLLVEIDENLCTSCGLCVKACPKNIIEIRKKGPRSKRIYVSCVSRDKAVVAKKACSNACIGCGKCSKICAFEAIRIEENVAYIDYSKCKLCRKCVDVCPTNAIHELNFPPKKVAPVETKPTSEAKHLVAPTSIAATV